MNKTIIKNTIAKTLEGKMSFPEVVSILSDIGIESYQVDFIRSENTYFTANGESLIEKIPHEYSFPAKEFSVEKVKACIKKVQKAKIDYITFSEEIVNAGCSFYIAYLSGKRVTYLGRDGDFYTEYFPKP